MDTALDLAPDRTAALTFFERHFPRGIERVLLVNPPDADSSLFRIETARRGRYTNYPPYGLGVLAQNLRELGVEVRLLNLNHIILKRARSSKPELFSFDPTWQGALAAEIEAFDPDLVGVTCMFTMTHTSFKRVCEFAARFGTTVAIGGVHVTNDVERVLDDVPHARIAFLREGDVAIKSFVRAARGEIDPSEMGQVILDDGHGHRLRFLAEQQPTEDEIDVLPAYDLCDIGELSQHGTIGAFYCFKPKGARFATVLSNRGCRAQCTFCSVRNFNGKRVRQRSVASVLDELQVLEEVHGIDHVMWLDDDLLKDHARAIALFDGKVRRGLKMTWDATNGLIAASCTDEVVAAMAASGCIAVNIGMESGSPEILRKVKKPGTVDNFVEAADILRKHPQIHSSVFLMVGFPGETMAQIMQTVEVAKRMDMDWYRISPVQPLPNTPMYDAMVEQGLVQAVGSKELRFMGGAYGKQTEIEQGQRMTTASFRDAFSAISPGAVPTEDQITDIWFYMNFHLNFRRLFDESRPEKVEQQLAHLGALSDVISPENGFALYFTALLQRRFRGGVRPGVMERLRARLDSSPYWRDRFAAFDLSVEDFN